MEISRSMSESSETAFDTIEPSGIRKSSLPESNASSTYDGSPLSILSSAMSTRTMSDDDAYHQGPSIPWLRSSPFVIQNSQKTENRYGESKSVREAPSIFPLTPKFSVTRLPSHDYTGLSDPTSLPLISSVQASLSQLFRGDASASTSNSTLHLISTPRRFKTRSRRVLSVFLLLSSILLISHCIIGFLHNSFTTVSNLTDPHATASPSGQTALPLSLFEAHPLQKLISEARKSWQSTQNTQSKSYQDAVLEYQRRYTIEPPKGFKKWFEFAQSNKHVLIDEYDSMMEQLTPFRNLSRHRIRSRTNLIGEQAGFGLIKLSQGRIDVSISDMLPSSRYTNHDHENHEFDLIHERLYNRTSTFHGASRKEIHQTQTWAFAKLLDKILGDDRGLLQDMNLAVNEHFEPRVVMPWLATHSKYTGSSVDDLETIPVDKQLENWSDVINDREDGAWETFRNSCPPDSEARRLLESLKLRQESDLTPRAFKDATFRTRRLIPPQKSQWGQVQPPLPPGSSPSPHLTHIDFNPTSESQVQFATESPAHISEIYCRFPSRRMEQGLFFSNTSKLQGLFPVFSSSTAQGFADIVIPSYLYTQDPYRTREYVNEPVVKRSGGAGFMAAGNSTALGPSQWKPWNVHWEGKSDQIYWRGIPQDGGNSPAGVQPNFVRHRIVKKFGSARHTLSEASVWISKPSRFKLLTSIWQLFCGTRTPSPSLALKRGVDRSILNQRSMDVAFVALDDCDNQESCQELWKGDYRFKKWEPFGSVKYYKWALDVDGIGYSAKFLNFLQAGTAVVKQTIYREYFSDWLVPWVHFIPLSVEGHEMYNIWNYFLARNDPGFIEMTKQGAQQTWEPSNNEQELKEIADEGKRWGEKIGRDVDWEVYTYRLLIEWGRIWNESEE